jgi:hypothetical protein
MSKLNLCCPPATRFSFPSMVTGTDTVFMNTFKFPQIPTGLTFTGAFLPCINAPTFGGGLSAVTWVLLRNGQPELSWVGYTILEDFQGFGGDTITIQAYNLPNGNVTVTWQGVSYIQQYTPLTLPTLNTSGPIETDLAASFQTATVLVNQTAVQSNNSYPFTFANPPSGTTTIKFYSVSLSISVACGNAFYALNAWIGADHVSPSQTTLVAGCVEVLTNQSANVTLCQDMNGIEFDTATQTFAIYCNTLSGGSLVGEGLILVNGSIEYAWF